MDKILDILRKNKRIIGIWGYPNPDVLKATKEKYPDSEIIDLDINYGAPSSNILPDAYCKIITNIVDNAFSLKDNIDIIVASVGEEKCDSARIAAKILANFGFQVVQTKYVEYGGEIYSTPISTSNMPLKEKINTIMDGVIKPVKLKIHQSVSTMGFWGVPPNDLSILELFPDTTHVFGWIRCVEAGRPADLDLEMLVNPDIPIVFFAQTFCAKMQLAKYLARKHNGLYVDIDDVASNSVRAKIEAFVRLR